MSPYQLLQEQVSKDRHYPWRVGASCILLNRTSGVAAHRVAGELFHHWNTPEEYLERAYLSKFTLHSILRPLGFQWRRADLLQLFTHKYLAGEYPGDCHGLGEYGKAAVRLFCLNDLTVRPDDGHLALYHDWRITNGIFDRIEWDEVGYFEWLAGDA